MAILEIEYYNQKLEIDYFLHRGEEKTLVYLHAGACSKEDFFAATKNELKKYTILGFDFPGCGGSKYPLNQSIDVDDLTEITRLIVKKLNLSDIAMIGHSLGGLVALLYIRKYNDASTFINIEGNLAEENCLFSRKVANQSFAEFKNNTLPKLLAELKKAENEGFRKWALDLERSSAQAFYDCCASLVEYSVHGNLVDKYISLTIPTLYMYGSENKQDLTFLDKLEQNSCRTHEVSASNHFISQDNPKDFFETIASFLKSNVE